MQVWNVLRAARWKYRRQKIAKKSSSSLLVDHHTCCTTTPSYRLWFNYSTEVPDPSPLDVSLNFPPCSSPAIKFNTKMSARCLQTAGSSLTVIYGEALYGHNWFWCILSYKMLLVANHYWRLWLNCWITPIRCWDIVSRKCQNHTWRWYTWDVAESGSVSAMIAGVATRYARLWPLCIAGCGHIYFHPVVSSSLWSPYVIGQTIIFLSCYFYLLLSIFFFFLA